MNISPEMQGFLGCVCGLLVVVEAILVAEWLREQQEAAEANAWIEVYFAAVRADRAKRDQWGRYIAAKRRVCP